MAEAVLDASAVLALLHGEPGGETVRSVLPHSVISTVNLSEVIAELVENGIDGAMAVRLTEAQPFRPMDHTLNLARIAGTLRAETRSAGLSLGDRACLALALDLGLPVFTADRAWRELPLDIEVRSIR
ncbi:MAG: type II toxin-antitoxin system VapC family toxin [Defluviicoccus sp.]|nr:type II toxin-antitoxin system VapC family toxin [Defluviicoccus sp.]